VPLDGFSFADQLFAFFTTDHFAHRKVMGRSVRTRCRDAQPDFVHSRTDAPLQIQYLTSFSDTKFSNVSVERVQREMIHQHQLPGQEEGLLIWGTGAYRSDNIYLAFLPLDDPRTRDNLFADGALPVSQLGLWYFTDYITTKQADTATYARVFHALLEAGVYLAPSQYEAAFASTAHDEATLTATLTALHSAFALAAP
jgi:hypothetical protein